MFVYVPDVTYDVAMSATLSGTWEERAPGQVPCRSRFCTAPYIAGRTRTLQHWPGLFRVAFA